MDIGKLCTREVIGIAAQASVREAAIRMCEEHVGSLVAINEDDPPKVVGMVTDRDLALDVVGRDDGGEALRVGDIAKSPPLAVPSTSSLSEAVQAMNQARVRRLLVVDDDGGVVGILAAEDRSHRDLKFCPEYHR